MSTWNATQMREFREELGLSQPELAEALASHRTGTKRNQPYSRQQISGAERGAVGFMSIDMQAALSSLRAAHLLDIEGLQVRAQVTAAELQELLSEGRVFSLGENPYTLVLLGDVGDQVVKVDKQGIPHLLNPILSECAFCKAPFAKRSNAQKYCPAHKDRSSRMIQNDDRDADETGKNQQ